MPIVVDSRGITTYVSHEHAEALANECLNRVEGLLSRGEFGLSERDRQIVQDEYAAAEDLVRQLEGEAKHRYDDQPIGYVSPPRPRYVPPTDDCSNLSSLPEDPEADARRTRLAQAILELNRQIEELGQDDDGDDETTLASVVEGSVVEPPATLLPEPTPAETPEPESKVASVKLDRERALFVVSGAGRPAMEFADRGMAEREARRRVGMPA